MKFNGAIPVLTTLDKDRILVGPEENYKEHLLIAHEFLHHAVNYPWFAMDGNLVIIKGEDATICYELLEESPMSLTWWSKKVKYIKHGT